MLFRVIILEKKNPTRLGATFTSITSAKINPMVTGVRVKAQRKVKSGVFVTWQGFWIRRWEAKELYGWYLLVTNRMAWTNNVWFSWRVWSSPSLGLAWLLWLPLSGAGCPQGTPGWPTRTTTLLGAWVQVTEERSFQRWGCTCAKTRC